jgi:plasmid stabilization system protein ParE
LKVRLLKAAEKELDEGVSYYEAQVPGLGNEFLEETRAAIDRIKQYPEAWHAVSRRTRRYQVKRFPYGVIYQIRQDELLIVAIAHLHRKPGYWRNRIQSQT